MSQLEEGTNQTHVHPEAETAELAVSMALNAQQSGNWEQALSRWQQGRERFPHVPLIWASETATLSVLARLGEAEALIAEAFDRFPGDVDVAAQYLNVALSGQNWREAQRRWEHFEQAFPGHGYIRTNGSDIRRRIAEGLESLNWQYLREDAAAADAVKDWVRSAEHWGLLYRRDSKDAMAILGYGRALRESGQNEAADRVLLHGAEAYPDNAEIRANHAEVASARGDWSEAARRWEMLLREHADIPALWLMASIAYGEVGSYDLAESLLARAIEAEPERVELRKYHAKLAERRQDWAVAVARWETAHRMQPDDLQIRNWRGDAIWEETAKRLESGERPVRAAMQNASAMADASEADAAALKQVALAFEGLGDNCEFGIVQRHFGAEPIGLFRFAAINARALIDLTRESFTRLGDPDYIELRLAGGDEFLVTDTRGLYHMHSFIRKGLVDEADFLRKQVTRLDYLKKKLIEDLREAEKIFVHKSSADRLSDEIIREIHGALSQFGEIMLLAIRRAEEGHPTGSIEKLDNGILVGYVETLYDGDGRPIDFEAWRSILVQSYHHKVEIDQCRFRQH